MTDQFTHIGDVKVGKVKAIAGFTLSSVYQVNTLNLPAKKPAFTK